MHRILRGLELGSNLSEAALFCGGVDLPLALTKTCTVLIRIFVYTLVALHAFDIVDTIFIRLCDRSATGIALIKTGETGPACWLSYDRSTGRLSEVANPHVGDDF